MRFHQTGICSRAGLVAGSLLLAGCAADPAPAVPEVFARTQVFCYRTLAEVDCHPAPLAGEEHRYAGSAWSGPVRLPVIAVPGEAERPS